MTHEEKVVKKAIRKFTKPDMTVSVDDKLEGDLGLDSLDTIELVMELEHQLDIQLPDNYLHDKLGRDWKKATVQQWIEVANQRLSSV